MMPMPTMQQLQHMQAVQQQVPNQSQPPPQAQQQPPSQTQQTSQTPHLQNQQFLSAHAQPDQNQRNVIKQRESSLFNSYVYDFLKRSGAHETARTYLREGENLKIKNDGANSINGSGNTSSDNNVGGPLPDADVPVQAPEGFLYEWWTVFWDIYSVKLNRQGTMEAQRYVAERRGNRMMGQIPTMNAYQNPQVVAQAAQAQAAQAVAVQHQQQMRMMQQIPQHQPQQAQQTSQQTVQQQPQQAPSQPSQPPQQPQQTPQQPQPQPSPANHQPQPFSNRQQIPNGVIDNNNGDMLVTSPQRTNTIKAQQQRRPPMNMQLPPQVPRNTMLAIQQQQPQHPHQALQNNAQTQAVQSQTQNSQPIQSQGQQNSVVSSGQVQQQTASQVHMTPNQAQAQLNPGTKRGVEAQAINQSLSMQATSPNKRQKMEYSSAITGQRQQQPNQQQGQMMNSSMMLTTPVSNEIASPSPDLKNRQSHLSNVKKNNPQLQQIPRGPQQQMTPMNKQHVSQQMAMVQNTVAHNDSEYLNHMNQIQNQLNKQITASNQTMQNISSFIPMHQGVRLPQNYIQNMQSMMIQRNKMTPNMLQHLNDKPRNINELGQQMGRPIPGAHLYMLPHQIPGAVGDVGPNNNSAQQLRKNEVKGAKNGKTTPTQSQPQVPNGNVSNVATIQQPVIGTNEVQNLNHLQNLQSQLQQPTQTSSTALADGSLEMNMDEVNNYITSVDGELDFENYLNLDSFDEFSEDQLGSSSNAGPSNGN